MPLSMRRRVQELVRKAADKAGVTIERNVLTTSVGPATFRLRASRLIRRKRPDQRLVRLPQRP